MVAFAFSGNLSKRSFSNFTVSAFQLVPKKRFTRLIKATDLYNPVSLSAKRCLPKLALVIISSSQNEPAILRVLVQLRNGSFPLKRLKL
jgi:hypothetical protein